MHNNTASEMSIGNFKTNLTVHAAGCLYVCIQKKYFVFLMAWVCGKLSVDIYIKKVFVNRFMLSLHISVL